MKRADRDRVEGAAAGVVRSDDDATVFFAEIEGSRSQVKRSWMFQMGLEMKCRNPP